MDDVDRAIVVELEADGRRAFREIARQVGVSEATVRARVRRLEETGLLQIVAFADPAKMGNSAMALLFLRVAPAEHDNIVAELSGRPEVSYLSTVLGNSDLCVQVVVRDQVQLGEFVRNQVRTLPGVIDTQTIPETVVHKLWFGMPGQAVAPPTADRP